MHRPNGGMEFHLEVFKALNTHLEGKPVASTTVNKVGDSGDLLEVIRISEGPMQMFLSEQGELLPQETDPL